MTDDSTSRVPLSTPPTKPTNWWKTLPGQAAIVAMLIGAFVVVLGAAGVIGPRADAIHPASADPGAGSPFTVPAGVTAPPTTEVASPELETLTLDCNDSDYNDQPLSVTRSGESWDFASAWTIGAADCEASSSVGAETPLEDKALKASGYTDSDIGTLIALCAEVDPNDVYAESGFAMSASQIAETAAALMLCPKHPHAKAWQAAMKRGAADAKLEADGKLFGDGTYRVGSEVKAGTYVATDVDGCYWERQNRNGKTIDNYFAESAKRVQVTIYKSDYAFHTEGCGTWRPAS